MTMQMTEAELRAMVLGELRVAVVPIRNIEFRDATGNPDGSWTMSGLAAVFDQETTIYDGTYYKRREKIAPEAFNNVLSTGPLVHFNLGHDMNRAVAATDVPAGDIGSLKLTAGKEGLEFLAKVDPEDPDAFAMGIKMKRGVIKQASFAFSVKKDEYHEVEDDGKVDELRTILEIKNLYDVCCTPQGAYPQTTAGVRSLFAAMGHPGDGGLPHQPGNGGARIVSDGDARARRQRKARAALAILDYPEQEN